MAIPAPKSWHRAGNMTNMFAKATQNGYLEYLRAVRQLNDSPKGTFDFELMDRCNIAGAQAIVFSGMCLEAAIYDHAAVHLGDKYVSAHLDKLDLLSKWIVVLRMIHDYEMDKDQAPYEALKQIIHARNRIVHSRSSAVDETDRERFLKALSKKSGQFYEDVNVSLQAIVLLSLDLDRVIGFHNVLPYFGTQMNPPLVFPPEIEPVIKECRCVVDKIKNGGTKRRSEKK